jgi:hypothetical protein
MTSIKGWESSLWPSHQGMGIYPHIMSKSHIYMLYYLNGILRQAQDDIVMVSLSSHQGDNLPTHYEKEPNIFYYMRLIVNCEVYKYKNKNIKRLFFVTDYGQ